MEKYRRVIRQGIINYHLSPVYLRSLKMVITKEERLEIYQEEKKFIKEKIKYYKMRDTSGILLTGLFIISSIGISISTKSFGMMIPTIILSQLYQEYNSNNNKQDIKELYNLKTTLINILDKEDYIEEELNYDK